MSVQLSELENGASVEAAPQELHDLREAREQLREHSEAHDRARDALFRAYARARRAGLDPGL